jgi:hypothetical protein
MVFNLSLSPDAEARLRDRAQASGLTPEECARRIVEEAVTERQARSPAPASGSSSPPPSEAEIARRIQVLNEWTGSVKTSWPVDDSRESIYGDDGRGA